MGAYTRLVERMPEGIAVRLGVDYLEHKAELDALAEKEKKVRFGGRLGEYKYDDMDASSPPLLLPQKPCCSPSKIP